MPKSKRMKNNASSAQSEPQTVSILLKNAPDRRDDSKELILKHSGLRKTYLKPVKFSNDLNGNDLTIEDGDGDLNEGERRSIDKQQNLTPVVTHEFMINNDIVKLFTKHNFPARYPAKLEAEDSEVHVLSGENEDPMTPVGENDSRMNKSFIRFWNKMITKQDLSTNSILNHQITEKEAGYFPCQLKAIFDSPEAYLKKPFCQRLKYTGPGYQLICTPNQFFKVSRRSLLKAEVNEIFQYYSNTENQNFLIPIEMTSKLSRSMLKSMEIFQLSKGCNKINFVCNSQNAVNKETHPLFTIEYKNSIEEEILPAVSLSLMDSYPQTESPIQTTLTTTSQALKNHPFLSHFLHRKDFSIDNFYARCWHYSRFFCQSLDLGARMNSLASVSIKDTIFKYLLACSARICIAIKYWVLNPEQATYFRCWCGHKMHNSQQESKMLKKYTIGSAMLYNYQQKMQSPDGAHYRHTEHKSNIHICACSQQFKDHLSWFNHAISTKISDISKICPLVLYNLSKTSQANNRFICECSHSFSDYDFWSFWIHINGCKVFRDSVKSSCHCSDKQKEHRSLSASRKSQITRKRKQSSLGRDGNKGGRKIKKQMLEEIQSSDDEEPESSGVDFNKPGTKEMAQLIEMVENDKIDEADWQSGDNVSLPLKFSNQSDTNQSTSSKQKSNKQKVY